MKDVTLADYIRRTMETLKDSKEESKQTPVPDNSQNQYEVYPEDDGYDRPRNPYSPV